MSRHQWKSTINHQWLFSPHAARDINFVIATAGNLSTKCASKSCPVGTRIVLFFDSSRTIGAYAKSLSFKQPIMALCMRQAALQVSSRIKAILIYVRSEINPTDKGIRD